MKSNSQVSDARHSPVFKNIHQYIFIYSSIQSFSHFIIHLGINLFNQLFIYSIIIFISSKNRRDNFSIKAIQGYFEIKLSLISQIFLAFQSAFVSGFWCIGWIHVFLFIYTALCRTLLFVLNFITVNII